MMGRSPCCSDDGVKRGPWSPEEDERLVDCVKKHGPGNWQTLPKRAGLNRCGKSCRLRWTNYLRPDIKRGPFSEEEDAIIIRLHEELGNKWSRIAAYLPGRTDNEIKNYWNTHLRKKLLRSGIDPKTHKQITDINLLSQLLLGPNLPNLITPLNPALSFPATEMVTNFQFLQRLQTVLQVINSSPVPYLQAISQLNRLINGANTQNSTGGDFFQPQAMLADLGNITPLLKEHLPSASNSLQCCEGELSPQGVLANNKTTVHTNIKNSEYSLPSLASVTPESSIVNPLESTKHGHIPLQAFESDIFDTLDNFLDDEASSSFLKDIMG